VVEHLPIKCKALGSHTHAHTHTHTHTHRERERKKTVFIEKGPFELSGHGKTYDQFFSLISYGDKECEMVGAQLEGKEVC
jgi:hypothetical protein